MNTLDLGKLLVKDGFMTEQNRRTVKKSCGHQSAAFAKSVLSMGMLSEDELASFLAEHTRFEVAPKDFVNVIETHTMDTIDPNMVARLEVIPMEISHQYITVAMVDPLDRSVISQLEFFTGLMVQPTIAPLSQIHQGLKKLIPNFTPLATPLDTFLTNYAASAWKKHEVIDRIEILSSTAGGVFFPKANNHRLPPKAPGLPASNNSGHASKSSSSAFYRESLMPENTSQLEADTSEPNFQGLIELPEDLNYDQFKEAPLSSQNAAEATEKLEDSSPPVDNLISEPLIEDFADDLFQESYQDQNAHSDPDLGIQESDIDSDLVGMANDILNDDELTESPCKDISIDTAQDFASSADTLIESAQIPLQIDNSLMKHVNKEEFSNDLDKINTEQSAALDNPQAENNFMVDESLPGYKDNVSDVNKDLDEALSSQRPNKPAPASISREVGMIMDEAPVEATQPITRYSAADSARDDDLSPSAKPTRKSTVSLSLVASINQATIQLTLTNKKGAIQDNIVKTGHLAFAQCQVFAVSPRKQICGSENFDSGQLANLPEFSSFPQETWTELSEQKIFPINSANQKTYLYTFLLQGKKLIAFVGSDPKIGFDQISSEFMGSYLRIAGSKL